MTKSLTPPRELPAKIAIVARSLAQKHKATLDRLKVEHDQLSRPDFVWHYLLQSFATMGRAAGWQGLIGNAENYDQLRYDALAQLAPEARAKQVLATCKAAKVRMPKKKAEFILNGFEQIQTMGGPEAVRQQLLDERGRDAKIRFLKQFSGIGDKYARNIMMDVYHEDFRDSIAIDARIKALSEALGVSFATYADHEAFYLSVAAQAGLNGWELDRLIFNFQAEFLAAVKAGFPGPDRPRERRFTDEELIERIASDPDVLAGKPVIQGTRLSVKYILNLLAHESTVEAILDEHHGVAEEDVRACLLYASRAVSSQA